MDAARRMVSISTASFTRRISSSRRPRSCSDDGLAMPSRVRRATASSQPSMRAGSSACTPNGYHTAGWFGDELRHARVQLGTG
jgi:hypothetical protein